MRRERKREIGKEGERVLQWKKKEKKKEKKKWGRKRGGEGAAPRLPAAVRPPACTERGREKK